MATKLTKVKIAHASFWYTKDDRMAMAFRGDEIEVNAEDYARGEKFEAFATEDEETEQAPLDEKPATDAKIDVITAYVGDDKERAAEYLAAEQAKGDDARSSLVDKLTAIVEAQA